MDNIRLTLVLVGSLLTILSVVPYLLEIIKGKTKPRVVSWFIWSVLTGVGAIAALVDGEYLTFILLTAAVIETMSVVILGWKRGDKTFETLDVVCLVGAIIGIILWQIFDSPSIAVIAVVSLDLVGAIPTIVHSYKKPLEETWQTYFICFIGSLLALLALKDWNVTSSAYPIYIVGINLVFTILLLYRQKILFNGTNSYKG